MEVSYEGNFMHTCIYGVSNRYQASLSHLGTRLTYYMLEPNQNSY